MAKTQEELNKLKQEYEQLSSKLQELSEEELVEIAGGEVAGIKDWFDKIGEKTKKIV